MPVFRDSPHRVSGERIAAFVEQRPDAVEAFPVLALRRDQPIHDRRPSSRKRIQLGVYEGFGREPPEAPGIGDLGDDAAVQCIRLRRPDPAFPDLRRLQGRYQKSLKPHRFRPPDDRLGINPGGLQDDLRLSARPFL